MDASSYWAERKARESAIANELQHESDRGVAIVGGAWVEEELTTAIESLLHKDKKAWNNLFSTSRPLSSFSAKIDLACLLGVTTRQVTNQLHILREIRNDFAHKISVKNLSPPSFQSGGIKDKCMELKLASDEAGGNARERFIGACAAICSDLEWYVVMSESVPKSPAQVRVKGEVDG